MTRLGCYLFFMSFLLLVPVAAQSEVAPYGQWIAPGQAVLIGQPFPMQLEIILPQGSELIDPGLPAIWGEYWLTPLSPIETTNQLDGLRFYRLRFSATLWSIGPISTLPLQVTYRSEGEASVQAFELPPVVIHVNSVLDPDDLNLRPMRPPLEMSFVSPLMMLGVLLMVAGFGYGVWYFLMRSRQHLSKRVQKSPARDALDELKRADRLDDPMRVHVRVVEVLRKFIGLYVGMPTADLTTDELLRNLPSTAIPQVRRIELQQLLEYADLVKFAQLKPSGNQRIISAARHWVSEFEDGDNA